MREKVLANKIEAVVVYFLISLVSALSVIALTKAFAQSASQICTIQAHWEHDAAEYPLIASWTLYMAESESGPWVAAAHIDHPDDAPLTNASAVVTANGPWGATVERFFRLTAWSRLDGTETPPSNIARASFVMPPKPVSAPSNLTITVILEGR